MSEEYQRVPACDVIGCDQNAKASSPMLAKVIDAPEQLPEYLVQVKLCVKHFEIWLQHQPAQGGF